MNSLILAVAAGLLRGVKIRRRMQVWWDGMVQRESGQGRWSRWEEGKRRQINGLWSVASLGKSVGVLIWMENVEGRHRAFTLVGTLGIE